MSVSGGQTIGSGYVAVNAPTNGLAVQGNVGIGTDAPTEKLDVDGNIHLSGELRAPATFIIDPAAIGDDTGTVEIKGNLT